MIEANPPLPRKRISVVTPCYNEESNIRMQYQRVCDAIRPFMERYEFEHIYTDNDSNDRTFEALMQLAAENKSVKIIRFSRNIGANRAIFMGLRHAAGDAAILLQADLQDPPELVPDFIKGWEEGYDVVYGRITQRSEGVVSQSLRRFYYWVAAAFSDVAMPRDAGEFRLMSRRVLDAIQQYSEYDPYLRGIVAHIGFAQKPIPYRRAAREKGRSSMTLAGLCGYAINGILSTTGIPIRAVVVLGLFLSMIGLLLTAIIVISKVAMPGAAPHGFTTLASLLAFFSGAQLFAIGMIGEYVHKIYVQSLRMPLGFVRDMINFD